MTGDPKPTPLSKISNMFHGMLCHDFETVTGQIIKQTNKYKQNKTKRNEAKRNEAKRNKTKRNEITDVCRVARAQRAQLHDLVDDGRKRVSKGEPKATVFSSAGLFF